MDPETLAERSGVSRDHIQAAEEGTDELADWEIGAMADALAVPVESLFAAKVPATASVVDYRKDNPRPSAPDAGTMTAMAFVERVSEGLASLGLHFRSDVPLEVVEKYDTETATDLAKKWRGRWGYTLAQQLHDQDAGKVYSSLREYIEGLGAFVLHYTFGHPDVSGFYTRVGAGPHTIVINTYQASKGRRVFTLAHEFCHLLTRKEGISDTSWIRNKIERFCNKFAAILLAPSKLITLALQSYGRSVSADNDFIRLFANRIGLSQDATFVRLVELEYLTGAQYSKWRAQFTGRIPTGDTGDRGGGGGDNAIQAKRTKYGTSLLRALDKARSEGLLDEIEIFQFVGLKPKYQSALFDTVALAAS